MHLPSVALWLLLAGTVLSASGCAPHEIVAGTNVAMLLGPASSPPKGNTDLRPAINASITAARAHIPVDIPTMLRQGDYVGAEQQLQGLQRRYEEDRRTESDFIAALGVITDTPDPDLEPLYLEWVRRAPTSFAPYLGAGVYYTARAFKARGGAAAAKTSEQQMRAMHAAFATAAPFLERARQLHPRLVASYAYSLRAAMAVCNHTALNRLKATALAIDPASLVVRAAYLHAMTPRWCGSLDAMRQFLDETSPYSVANPPLRFLQGRIAFEQGEELTMLAPVPRYEEALPHYTEALSHGESSLYRQGRAITLLRLGRYDEAIADLEVALRERPADRLLHEVLVYAKSKRVP